LLQRGIAGALPDLHALQSFRRGELLALLQAFLSHGDLLCEDSCCSAERPDCYRPIARASVLVAGSFLPDFKLFFAMATSFLRICAAVRIRQRTIGAGEMRNRLFVAGSFLPDFKLFFAMATSFVRICMRRVA
jgi:hypothetical protein